jgi:uncharacterized protein (DUF1778 family)
VPGKRLINVRVPEETAERFKEAAQRMKISLTRFLVEPAEKVANRVLGGDTKLVGTTAEETPVQVQAELRPAKPIPYGPDMPIGQMSSDQIERFLRGLLADEAEQAERRLDQEYYSSY